MSSELRNFLAIPYDELEDLNLQAKEQRKARVPLDQIQEERLRYLTEEKRIKAVTVLFSDLEGRLHMLGYAPFALLVATQMVLVLVAPSHGSSGGTQLGGQFQGGPAAQSGNAGPGVSGSVGTGAPGTTGVPGATGTTTGATGGGATSVGAGGATGGGLASGATTGGKACITGLTEHFPCAPKWAGGNNGGATWPGVTANQVTVVMY